MHFAMTSRPVSASLHAPRDHFGKPFGKYFAPRNHGIPFGCDHFGTPSGWLFLPEPYRRMSFKARDLLKISKQSRFRLIPLQPRLSSEK